MTVTRLLLVLYTLAAAGTSAAQAPIYRCGNSYSEQSCPQAREVVVPPAPGEDERAAAEQSLQRQATVAEELQRRRLQQEAQPLAAGGIRHAAADARQAAPEADSRGARQRPRSGRRHIVRHGKEKGALAGPARQRGKR
ncbi:hypothetical protein [Eleftheria terrae]|uniref:hypothetical protein n=1 Tax=Eleftheria terrae TaxID=1597781 RepID=UPI00263B2D81|nr:hypothetical protein [Eleftheria terrae]WKB52007.1 hypothetical protein N7L95_19735 [Eleftheria terrae]